MPPVAAPLQNDNADSSSNAWNYALTSARTSSGDPVYDGFVLHPYVQVDATIFTAMTAGKMLEASGVMRKYLTDAARNMQPPRRPLLLTEFGILGTTTGTFLQALGEASMFMGILDLALNRRANVVAGAEKTTRVAADGDEKVDIVQAGIHILLGGSLTTPSALFSVDPATNRTVATPTGVIWRKFVQVLAGSRLLHSSSSVPSLPSGSPAVDVQVVDTLVGRSLLVVNKLGIEAQLEVNQVALAGEPVALTVCSVEAFSRKALSWEHWPVDQVDSLWVDAPKRSIRQDEAGTTVVHVPALSVAVVQLCGHG